MRETDIRLRHLTKDYGSLRAVNDLNLEVYAGECFGFLDPNGAGKTTTIGMMLGLVHPTAGSVEARIDAHEGIEDMRRSVLKW